MNALPLPFPGPLPSPETSGGPLPGSVFIPESAPFSVEQRLWLNGYIAGLLAGRGYVPGAKAQSAAASVPGHQTPLLILFGSQTGTAQALAERISREAVEQGFKSRAVDASAHGSVQWEQEQNLLIVTSTYGDGDMPDNAQGFWDWLQTEAAQALAHLNYSVLALGDTNYEQFCAAGRKFDSRLAELGATRVQDRTDCSTDYEGPAREWTAASLRNLQASPDAAPVSPALLSSAVPSSTLITSTTTRFDKNHPFTARLLRNVCLNKPGSAKEVRHFEIHLGEDGPAYEVGDALGVWPRNNPALVSDVLAWLRVNAEEPVEVRSQSVSLGRGLSERLDLTKPSSELLALVAAREPRHALTQLLLPERRDELKTWLWGRGVIDLLELLATPLTPAELISVLRPLTPRLYSISSSPKAHPGEVHLTVAAVRYESHGRKREGVASTFLADRLSPDGDLQVFVQTSSGFRLPARPEVPIIMIGPGTGIAPFRAFLEERAATGATGRNWLFFGDQHRATDFLYEEQLNDWQRSGFLNRLDLAFSRDQPSKIYVQDQMLEQASTLWAWLQEGAHLYVCGDASRMARDVDAALHQIAAQAGGLTVEQAAEFVRQLKSERRYQRDVY